MSNFNSADIAAFKDVWVFCEQREGKLMPTDFELISKGRDLANELGVNLCGLLLGGEGIESAAKELGGYGAIAFGCPAMGSEVLEEMEFQPMFDEVKRSLGGKSAALFGSYGWGDGEWMRGWEKDCDDSGIRLVCESVTCCEAPDDAALDACRALGKELAK